MPSSHPIFCRPLLLLLPTPPSIRVFSNESTLRIRWPKYWSFSFNISPSSEYPGLISFRMDWLDLLAVQGTLKSLLQHHCGVISLPLLAPHSKLLHHSLSSQSSVCTRKICRYLQIKHKQVPRSHSKPTTPINFRRGNYYFSKKKKITGNSDAKLKLRTDAFFFFIKFFLTWTLFFLSLYWICYNIASFLGLVFWPQGTWDLSSLTKDGTTPSVVEGEILTTGPPGKSQGLTHSSRNTWFLVGIRILKKNAIF